MEYTHGPSSQQQPVGTTESVEELVAHVFARGLEDQSELLRAFAPLVLARLDPVEKRECEEAMRSVPTGQAKLEEPSPSRASGPRRETVMEELLRQSVGAQLHVLQLLSSRVLGSLRGSRRDLLLRDIFLHADRAEGGGPADMH